MPPPRPWCVNTMDNSQFDSKAPSGRRLFLKKGLAAGAAGAGIAVLAGTSTVFAQSKGLKEGGGRLSIKETRLCSGSRLQPKF
jgi:hypothetical protein